MPHPVDVMVGKRVRLRRLQLSLSQTELAQKLGLTFQQVQKYEKGTNRVSCSRLYEISEVLDVPITFFFSEKGETKAEVAVAEQLEPGQLKDGLRLITAFGQIVETHTRKRLLALVESMVPAGKAG
jgi:transcriptional regulator with XRE-family HTH domain